MTTPDRGDVIVVNLNPQAGHEQKKRRPALVLSPARFNDAFGVAFVAPVTSRPSRNAFEVALPSGLRVKGCVLTHQLRALDWRARRATAAGRVPNEVVDRVADIVKEIVS
jgi:mRNA interferase MazF